MIWNSFWDKISSQKSDTSKYSQNKKFNGKTTVFFSSLNLKGYVFVLFCFFFFWILFFVLFWWLKNIVKRINKKSVVRLVFNAFLCCIVLLFRFFVITKDVFCIQTFNVVLTCFHLVFVLNSGHLFLLLLQSYCDYFDLNVQWFPLKVWKTQKR